MLSTLSLSAKIHHIYESDGAQAIQDSVDVSGLDDTVMVHNGKYYIGDLPDSQGLQLMGRKLMSVSPDSAPSCTLTGLSSSGLDTALHVIRDELVSGCYSIIQGFTIINGKNPYPSSMGGGIRAFNFDSLIIQDNIITENIGRGIYLSSTQSIVQHNLILNNEGGGIYIMGDDRGWPKIRNNVIKDNVSYYPPGSKYNDGFGGGITLHSGATKGGFNSHFSNNDDADRHFYSTIIEDNLIIGNYAEYGGGGIASMHYARPYLNGNVIAYNEAQKGGGVYVGDFGGSNIGGENNIFIANRANEGGAIHLDLIDFTLGFCSLIKTFAVDNGSFDGSTGLICQLDESYKACSLNYSNIYYNTYQEDIEVFVDTSEVDSTFLEYNFWWLTDSASIDSLIDGPANFIPFEMGPVPDAPGEPVEIYSVLNYSFDYSTIVDSIGGDPDTLYLEITGHDNKHEYQEAAIAILKTNIYPTGIAVSLLETDKATGIYRGKAIVKTTNPPDSIRKDDIYQIIRVCPVADTIKVYANIDTTEMFRVSYRYHSAVEEDSEDGFLIEPVQNLISSNPEFRFFLPSDGSVELSIYDLSGRLVDEVLSTRLSSGWHIAKGMIECSGVYIYRLKTSFGDKTGKIVVVK